MPWKSFFIAALLSSCTTIPDIEGCSGTSEIAGVSAICRHSNTAGMGRRMSASEFIDWLYAQPARPDPAHAGKTLPAHGPAICISSEDYQKNDTALSQLCTHAPCSWATTKAISNATSQTNALIKDATTKAK